VKSAHFSVATLEIELPPLMMPPLRNFMAAKNHPTQIPIQF